MTLFDYFLHHRKAILFTIAALVVSGVASTLRMPVSLFPDVTFPRIVVLADNEEQPAERMMIEVTKPLEEVCSSIPGVQYVRSITGRGSAEISVGLGWHSDVLQTLQVLQGRIANIRNQLPATADVRAEQMTVAVFPVLGYSLTSDSVGMVELRDIALYQVRPALLRVGGIARVEVVGGDTREFQVIVSPDKLAAYHLDIREVSAAVARTNLLSGTGLVENNYHLYLSLVSGLLAGVDDIGAVVVAVRGGAPVHVADVAEVRPGVADKYIRTTANGKDAVLINILKQPTASTVQISADVADALSNLRLPPGVQFGNFYDQGDFIRSSILATRDSIIIGVILAMVVLIVALRSWRISLVIMLVVPATIATTLVCLSALGLTINIMTLGGIAAAIGLIVDDAIVIIENIFRRLSEAKTVIGDGTPVFTDTASRSVHDMMPAIIGSTASTIVIHIPLAFLGGITGAFFASLSITMVCAMLISFVFSMSLAPLLASIILTDGDIRAQVALEERPSSFERWYERAMSVLQRRRWLAVPAGLGIVAATWFLYLNVGTDFMPSMDEGTFVLDYATPPGTSLTETNTMLMTIEKLFADVPEIESYSRRTGTELGFFLTEPNTGDYLIKLKKERSRGIDDVISDLRERVQVAEPSVRIEFGQLMMDVIGDLTNTPSPVEIKLFGEDAGVLRAKAVEIERAIESVPGVVDPFDGIVISGPSFIVHVDSLKCALAGLSVDDVREELSTVMRGSAETSIQKGEKLMAVRVRYPDRYRTDLDRLERLLLTNANGVGVPIGSVATFEKTGGLAEIRRDGLRQMVAVTARISGHDLGGVLTEVRKKIAAAVVLPPGTELVFGGVYQTQQESFRGLLVTAIAAFMLVFIVLLFEFGEFAVPVSIFIINILSLFGVVAALWIAGVTFNISSFVGVIMIIGIVAENAIFVMHNVREYTLGGMPLDDALVRAVLVRKRPILMTTLAAVLSLLPLALGIGGAGAGMQQPLAIAVIGGFSLSSVMLFFGLPVFYRMMAKPAASGRPS
jgi:CzcA family heavy metal efflux pump